MVHISLFRCSGKGILIARRNRLKQLVIVIKKGQSNVKEKNEKKNDHD